MVKFELDLDESVPDSIFSKPKKEICPDCGELKILIEDIGICGDCGGKPPSDDDIEKAVESTHQEVLISKYLEEFPDKKPVYKRSGKEVESKHFTTWKEDYEETYKERQKEMTEEYKEKFDKDMVQFLDKFCIYVDTAKEYNGKIRNGNTLDSNFLEWYLQNTKKDMLKHLDYNIMTKKNQSIVKKALSIDEKPELNDNKSSKNKIEKATPPNINSKIRNNRLEKVSEKIELLQETDIPDDMDVNSLKEVLDNLWKSSRKDIEYQLYLVVNELSFLYDLMGGKMDFTKKPDDQEIEHIKTIKSMLNR